MKTKRNRVILKVFLMVACSAFIAGQAFSQSRFVLDSHVNLSRSDSVSGAKDEGEDRTVGSGGSDSAGARGRRKVRPEIASYNAKLVAAVYRECARYRIDPVLVFSLIWQESGGKLRVVSPKGAQGPLQLMPGTAAQYGARDPFDPDQAVRAGVAYLVALLDQFGGNVSQALAAYNAGAAPVDAFLNGKRIVLRGGKVVNPRGIRTTGGIPPYKETEAYVERIAQYYRTFRRDAVNKPTLSREAN